MNLLSTLAALARVHCGDSGQELFDEFNDSLSEPES
jgi:hypothetical protein